jgi:NAD(P)-binding Rossmann-like domain
MPSFETDYLVIGAGATGLAFADTLLQESDAHITLVDRHALPGGHWNDAYPYVTLHQPSAFYGVNSLALGSHRIDSHGPNAGLHELATGAEVCSYFQQVMQHQLLPSGRVRYLPMSEYAGVADGVATLHSLMTGATTTVQVRRKLVDASHFTPDVPATTAPKFAVAAGVRLATPTQLSQLGQNGQALPTGYCIVGAGKTAMDAAMWLLAQGVAPAAIHWVMPRDSWLVNRLSTQPGEEFFMQSIGGMALQMRALSEASGVDDFFLRLEACGQMLRIDRTQTPRMFHYATLSEGEVAALRQITQVIRRGRVLAIEPEALVLEHGRVAMPAGLLYINCTASAVRPRRNPPIFEPGKITPQLVRAPLVTFSAAVCAYVEAHYADDAEKNALCTPVPFPQELAGYITSTLVGQANQLRWNQDKTLRDWMRNTRLDGFGRLTSQVSRDDAEKMAVLAELRQQMGPALANAQRVLAGKS